MQETLPVYCWSYLQRSRNANKSAICVASAPSSQSHWPVCSARETLLMSYLGGSIGYDAQ